MAQSTTVTFSAEIKQRKLTFDIGEFKFSPASKEYDGSPLSIDVPEIKINGVAPCDAGKIQLIPTITKNESPDVGSKMATVDFEIDFGGANSSNYIYTTPPAMTAMGEILCKKVEVQGIVLNQDNPITYPRPTTIVCDGVELDTYSYPTVFFGRDGETRPETGYYYDLSGATLGPFVDGENPDYTIHAGYHCGDDISAYNIVFSVSSMVNNRNYCPQPLRFIVGRTAPSPPGKISEVVLEAMPLGGKFGGSRYDGPGSIELVRNKHTYDRDAGTVTHEERRKTFRFDESFTVILRACVEYKFVASSGSARKITTNDLLPDLFTSVFGEDSIPLAYIEWDGTYVPVRFQNGSYEHIGSYGYIKDTSSFLSENDTANREAHGYLKYQSNNSVTFENIEDISEDGIYVYATIRHIDPLEVGPQDPRFWSDYYELKIYSQKRVYDDGDEDHKRALAHQLNLKVGVNFSDKAAPSGRPYGTSCVQLYFYPYAETDEYDGVAEGWYYDDSWHNVVNDRSWSSFYIADFRYKENTDNAEPEESEGSGLLEDGSGDVVAEHENYCQIVHTSRLHGGWSTRTCSLCGNVVENGVWNKGITAKHAGTNTLYYTIDGYFTTAEHLYNVVKHLYGTVLFYGNATVEVSPRALVVSEREFDKLKDDYTTFSISVPVATIVGNSENEEENIDYGYNWVGKSEKWLEVVAEGTINSSSIGTYGNVPATLSVRYKETVDPSDILGADVVYPSDFWAQWSNGSDNVVTDPFDTTSNNVCENSESNISVNVVESSGLRVFLVDEVCSEEHYGEATRPDQGFGRRSWDWKNTSHTLENALYFISQDSYFSRYDALIVFDSKLAQNESKPVVSRNVQLRIASGRGDDGATGSRVVIDASKPYKRNAANEIVVDEECLNWDGVIIEYDSDKNVAQCPSDDPNENTMQLIYVDADYINYIDHGISEDFRNHVSIAYDDNTEHGLGLLSVGPRSVLSLINVDIRHTTEHPNEEWGGSVPLAICSNSPRISLTNCCIDNFACGILFLPYRPAPDSVGDDANDSIWSAELSGIVPISHCSFRNCGYCGYSSVASGASVLGGCIVDRTVRGTVRLGGRRYLTIPGELTFSLDNCLFENNNHIFTTNGQDVVRAVNCTFVAPTQEPTSSVTDSWSGWYGFHLISLNNGNNYLGFIDNYFNCFISGYRYFKTKKEILDTPDLIPRNNCVLINTNVSKSAEDTIPAVKVTQTKSVTNMFDLVWGTYNPYGNTIYVQANGSGSKTSTSNFLDGSCRPIPGTTAKTLLGKGSNDYVESDTDLDGNLRIRENVVDIGCYEYIERTPCICGFGDSVYPSVYKGTDSTGDHLTVTAFCGELKTENGSGDLIEKPVLHWVDSGLYVEMEPVYRKPGYWKADVDLLRVSKPVGDYVDAYNSILPYIGYISFKTDYAEAKTKPRYFVSLGNNIENIKDWTISGSVGFDAFYSGEVDENGTKLLSCPIVAVNGASHVFYTPVLSGSGWSNTLTVTSEDDETNGPLITFINGQSFITLKEQKNWYEKEGVDGAYLGPSQFPSTKNDAGTYYRYYECDTMCGPTSVSLFAYGSGLLWEDDPENPGTDPRIHITITDADVVPKEYDGLSTATVVVNSVVGVEQGDDVTVYGIGYYVDDATLDYPERQMTPTEGSDGWSVLITYYLKGNDAGKYILNDYDGTLTGTITKREIEFRGELPSADKEYDGTTDIDAVDISEYSLYGFLGGDYAECSVSSCSLEDKNVGENKKVTVTFDLGNVWTRGGVWGYDPGDIYKIKNAETTATVHQKPIVVEDVVVEDKKFDMTRTAEVTIYRVSGIVENDDVTVSAVGLFDNEEPGENKYVTVKYLLSGNDAVNYIVPPTKKFFSNIISAGPYVSWTAMSDNL